MTASVDGTICVFDLSIGEVKLVFDFEVPIRSMTYSEKRAQISVLSSINNIAVLAVVGDFEVDSKLLILSYFRKFFLTS